MVYLKPKLLQCHFCENVDAEVVFPSGSGLCCKCYVTLSPHLDGLRSAALSSNPTVRDLANLGSLEEVKQAVVVLLSNCGSSVACIADRLKITRTTVYSLLGRAKKCKSKT